MTQANKIAHISQVDRPEVGENIPILIFRAFRHFTADYVKQMLGKRAHVVFQNSGRDLGKAVGEMLMKPDLNEYLAAITKFVRDLNIGMLKLVAADDEKIVVSLDECITCAGMDPAGDERICHFEVGLVAGAVEQFVGKRVRAYETKCNMLGEGTCEVTVELGAVT